MLFPLQEDDAGSSGQSTKTSFVLLHVPPPLLFSPHMSAHLAASSLYLTTILSALPPINLCSRRHAISPHGPIWSCYRQIMGLAGALSRSHSTRRGRRRQIYLCEFQASSKEKLCYGRRTPRLRSKSLRSEERTQLQQMRRCSESE